MSRPDYYNRSELRVEIDKGCVRIRGVFDSQDVARTSMWA